MGDGFFGTGFSLPNPIDGVGSLLDKAGLPGGGVARNIGEVGSDFLIGGISSEKADQDKEDMYNAAVEEATEMLQQQTGMGPGVPDGYGDAESGYGGYDMSGVAGGVNQGVYAGTAPEMVTADGQSGVPSEASTQTSQTSGTAEMSQAGMADMSSGAPEMTGAAAESSGSPESSEPGGLLDGLDLDMSSLTENLSGKDKMMVKAGTSMIEDKLGIDLSSLTGGKDDKDGGFSLG